ncbi:hypothetical protein G7Y89_g5180 [Cudoniella acicularis]|uniref:Mitochondrial chaperone BCS1-like ATPase lid domain-containing protein n=1 Tax=Cudoniella acicularis TaxID=354080 RepID=A0A8H4W6Q5_9HELO|nr:hypothetical protein G7Y89_g5180 [Cudoniella acicularis]
MTADLFCVVFKPVEGDVTPPKNAQSDVLVREDREAYEAIRSQGKEVKRVEQLAEKFAASIPELKFSPAEILLFLLRYKESLREAIDNVGKLVSKLVDAKSKPPGVSEAKPGDTQPDTPPDSPRLLPVLSLSDGQATEMANAIAAMQ